MANIVSEQIKSDFSLELNFDQPLSTSNIIGRLKSLLGNKNCTIEKVNGKKVFCYYHDNKCEVLLIAAITYMGGNGQHPIFKKRMQLKKWYKDIVEHYSNKNNYNVRFVGVYHYQNNIIFTEFIKDSYLNKKMNSSAAHVYINDLFQAMKFGVFKRFDRNKNELVAVNYLKFKDYLDGKLDNQENDLFKILEKFNKSLSVDGFISAKDAIIEMHEGGWNKWKETEWASWFLEYKLSCFIKNNGLEHKLSYIGSSNKKVGELDFDLWFDEEKFFGDLKASDEKTREAPGNDQENFLNSLKKHGKFWYIIYEHETIKDSAKNNYEATRFRTNYIKDNNEWPKNKTFDELSYHNRMKNSVRFTKMYVIELNEVNYREVLNDFNQGRQPNGDKRKPKFKITKNNIENFIIYQEIFYV